MAILRRRVRAFDLVTSQLLDQEPVVRLVVVQCVDHVIAIPPGVRLVAVALVAVGLGIAHQIEPVPRPALAVLRTGQQAVDHLRDRIGRPILDKRPNLLRAWAAGRSGRDKAGGSTSRRSASPTGLTPSASMLGPSRTDRSGLRDQRRVATPAAPAAAPAEMPSACRRHRRRLGPHPLGSTRRGAVPARANQ